MFKVQNRNPFIDHPEYANLIWGDSNTTGLDEIKDIKEITLYPNPASDFITIEIPFEGDVTGEIVNASGFSLLQFSLVGSSIRINLNEWCDGIYFLKISNGDVNYHKIVVVLNLL